MGTDGNASRAASLRAVFRARSAGPLWTSEGVFTYPPRDLWSPIAPAAVSEAWRSALAEGDAGPYGLYVHVPPEVDRIGDFFPSRKTHAYTESLQREAALLALPEGIPFETLYIGGGGAGALSKMSPKETADLLAWLREGFGISSPRQTVTEIDAAATGSEAAKALAGGGVDRVAVRWVSTGRSDAEKREAFVRGVEACRKAGIGEVHIDFVVGRKDQTAAAAIRDIEWAGGLGTDGLVICDYGGLSPEEAAAVRAASEKAAADGKTSVGNEQLSDVGRRSASILGLGWSAISHLRSRLSHACATSCFLYVDDLLNGRPARYAGAPINRQGEKRAHVIRALEDTGEIPRKTYEDLFGEPPEKTFPAEFAALAERGLIERSGDSFRAAGGDSARRFAVSVTFYERAVLAGLADLAASGKKKPAEHFPGSSRVYSPDGESPDGPEVPRRSSARLARGVEFLRGGDAERAAGVFDELIAEEPGNVEALINRAAAASLLERAEEAVLFYDRAVAAAPPPGILADALAARAGVLQGLRRFAEAAADFAAALQAAPKSWPRRGETLSALNETRTSLGRKPDA